MGKKVETTIWGIRFPGLGAACAVHLYPKPSLPIYIYIYLNLNGAVVPVCTFRVLGFGFWVLGFGFWILGFGFWILGWTGDP